MPQWEWQISSHFDLSDAGVLVDLESFCGYVAHYGRVATDRLNMTLYLPDMSLEQIGYLKHGLKAGGYDVGEITTKTRNGPPSPAWFLTWVVWEPHSMSLRL